MRETKYLQIKKKERSLALIDYIQEEDFFKIQQVTEQNCSDLSIVKTYAKILHRFASLVRENNVRFPPIEAVKVLSQSVIALIIEVTALSRSSSTESFNDLFALVQFT